MTHRLSLGGLSEREVAEYVELTAAEIASSDLVAALYEDTEGNPLFVGEIVRLLSVEGVQSESTADVRLAIPQSVRDVIARRLTHLSEECNRMLVLASVLGREFGLEALARLGGLSEDELLERLDEAMAARVLSDVPGTPGRLRFAHVLIRDTLYEGLTIVRRVGLHRQAVAAIETLYGDDPGADLAELVHHAIAGSEFAKGLLYGRRAGDRAFALLAYEEAARLYGTSLEALDLADPSDEKTRCELLLLLGEAEACAGNTPAARDAFLDAAEIARRLGLAHELARAAAGYGGRDIWARAGRDSHLIPLLEEGLSALGEDDVELRTRLLARLAGALRDEHSRDRRDRLSREAVTLARRAGNPAALAYALDGRAGAIVAPDTISECVALGQEYQEVATRISDPEHVVYALDSRRTVRVMVGELREAEGDLVAGLGIAEELRQPAKLWQIYAARAMFALAARRLGEAEELIPQAYAFGERAIPDTARPVLHLQRYALCDLRGGLEEVAPAIRDLAVDYPARPAFRCALAHLQARLGPVSEAQQAVDLLTQDHCSTLPFDQEWLYGMSLLAETAALLGDRDSAAVIYEVLVPWRALNAADHPEGIRGSVARYLGLLATTMSRWGEAEQDFEDALAMNEEMGVRPWLAHSQRDYAQMLLGRDGPGDRERARELLNAALTTYRELGMESFAATAGKHQSGRRPRGSESVYDVLGGSNDADSLGSSRPSSIP